MAKIPFGILGPFSGKAGTVIGTRWKGKAIMRSLRSESARDEDPTPKQAVQRTKFGFVSKFMKGLAPLVKRSYAELAVGKTEFQCAISHNLCNAVSGSSPHFILHYDKVSVGRGTLPNAELPEAKGGDTPATVRFFWADNTGMGLASADDEALAVIYCPALKRWVHESLPKATRADGSLTAIIPAFSGKTVHTWLTFVSDNEKASDSVYTGEIILG